MIRQPPRSPLFPSPTLSRSVAQLPADVPAGARLRLTVAEVSAERVVLRIIGDANVPAQASGPAAPQQQPAQQDRKSTRLKSSHANISYAVFCLKKKNNDVTL